jgi:hypothetical protein
MKYGKYGVGNMGSGLIFPLLTLAEWPVAGGDRWLEYVNHAETEAELKALRRSAGCHWLCQCVRGTCRETAFAGKA